MKERQIPAVRFLDAKRTRGSGLSVEKPPPSSDEDDDDETTDAAFERRHRPLEQFEHRGFAVLPWMRDRVNKMGCPVPSAGEASLSDAALPVETAMRRTTGLLIPKPAPGCCLACAPYYKHVAHICDKARPPVVESDPLSGCPACPPYYKHVAHTCGKTYAGKRYGKKRRKGHHPF